ncbi:cobalamin biosynthesis protein CobQ [Mesoaciditoga lauensis]|uniref:cobalamin biosynthesis protein CobQ n=1 Tax=Mesoaciditoga lauensis TaxID=1495039 RepID=UPI00056915BD|nr:cobalamin biosynthesis protein CobQ [Mesoaciditoga lauensis]
MNFEMFDARVFVYVGMFGSGKTEIAINTAVELKSKKENVALLDIDVISPYFRSRDKKEPLEKMGIKVISPPGALSHADLPIITAQVGGYISNEKFFTVADVGGNEDGATVLGSLKPFLDKANKKVFFVVNTLRPFSTTFDEIVRNIKKISAVSRTKIDYLVNNTNIAQETTEENVKRGEELIKKVSEYLEIPVAFSVINEDMNFTGDFPVFKLKRYLTDLW